MLVSFNAVSALTVVLLIAGIVACVFMTILLSRLIHTIDEVNGLLGEVDDSMREVKKQVENVIATLKSASGKIGKAGASGANTVRAIANKLPFIK